MASGTTSVLITHYYVVIATAISDGAHLQYQRHEAQQLTGLYLTSALSPPPSSSKEQEPR